MRKKRQFKQGKKNNLNLKNKKQKRPDEPINKKAIFNRYKDKQKIEEELVKKHKLEEKFKNQYVSSESEEELDSYSQLLSTFSDKTKQSKMEVTSGDESEEISDHKDLDSEVSDSSSISSEIHQEETEKETEIGTHVELEEDADIEIDLDTEPIEQLDNDDDPFIRHFQYDLDNSLLIAVSSVPPVIETVKKTWPILGDLTITIPKPLTRKVEEKKKITLLENKTFANAGTVPNKITDINLNGLFIKSQIQPHIVTANTKNLIKKDLELSDIYTPLQKELFSVVNNYQDLYYPERTFSNSEEIRFVYCMHAVNHVLKTRTKILHHNAKLAKKTEVPDEFRDQGLVRPKVLILLPFKDAAYKTVNTIIDILVPKEAGQVLNKNRFEDDFTGGSILMPKKNPKPEDYELLFNGNTDDTFRLGMTLTKKTLKLYTDFYSSDIIVASPLGLRVIIGAEGEEDRDYDFLASIEVLIMDQSDIFLMQNWDHVLHILDHLHLQPKKTHDTDFSRIRSWAVNGWTKYYRQTLMFSSVSAPELNAVMNKRCHNYAGKVRVANAVALGAVRQVALQIPQVFHRFTAADPLSAAEARFQHFVKEVLPRQRDPLMSHTLVYVPSYFDYVRIRNYFKKEDISFVQICEYSKEGKIARARDMFFHTEAHFLLYSERAHFYRRLRVKGVRHLLFYQPPAYPHFYSELCNLMQEANQNKYGGSACNMSVTVLFCKYDLQQVAALLGSERTASIAHADKHVHIVSIKRLRVKGVRHLLFYQPPAYPHFYSELCNLMQEANQNKYGGSACNMSVTVLFCKYDLQQVAALLGSERTASIAHADKHVHMFVTGD